MYICMYSVLPPQRLCLCLSDTDLRSMYILYSVLYVLYIHSLYHVHMYVPRRHMLQLVQEPRPASVPSAHPSWLSSDAPRHFGAGFKRIRHCRVLTKYLPKLTLKAELPRRKQPLPGLVAPSRDTYMALESRGVSVAVAIQAMHDATLSSPIWPLVGSCKTDESRESRVERRDRRRRDVDLTRAQCTQTGTLGRYVHRLTEWYHVSAALARNRRLHPRHGSRYIHDTRHKACVDFITDLAPPLLLSSPLLPFSSIIHGF